MANPTLLIVEDNKAQQLVYKQLCEMFDFRVVFCATGEDAIEALKLARYAAVIIDWKLPGISGIEVASMLRQMESRFKVRTPIIALTASTCKEAEKSFRGAGVDEFMTKPFAINDFRKMLLRRVYEAKQPNLKLLNKPKNASDIVKDAGGS
jgi:CheY-like chemotaxis protein